MIALNLSFQSLDYTAYLSLYAMNFANWLARHPILSIISGKIVLLLITYSLRKR